MHKNSSIMHSSVRQCITKGFLSRILKIESSSKGGAFLSDVQPSMNRSKSINFPIKWQRAKYFGFPLSRKGSSIHPGWWVNVIHLFICHQALKGDQSPSLQPDLRHLQNQRLLSFHATTKESSQSQRPKFFTFFRLYWNQWGKRAFK